MRRLTLTLLACLFALGSLAAIAEADEFDQFEITEASASLSDYQAGAHADFTTELKLKTEFSGGDVAQTRDVSVKLPPGLIGNPNAIPRCSQAQLNSFACPVESLVGVIEYVLRGSGSPTFAGVYNMPPAGRDIAGRLGFIAGFGFPVTINFRLRASDYGLTADVEGIPSAVPIAAARTTIWGVPGSPTHDLERLRPEENQPLTTPRPSTLPPAPFLYNPSYCGVPLKVAIAADTYQRPGQFSSREATIGPLLGCGALIFNPSVSLKPTTSQASSATGLEYRLSLPTKGLELPNIPYGPQLRRAEVLLPEGMTVNPSQAEGLGVCSEADFARETFDSAPNVGCPESSKIGNVSATTPVLDHQPAGSLYVARPYANPFGSLLALYMVLKVPDRGVLVRLAGKVELDPHTGRLKTVFDDVPQLPVADFTLHFREGARAPLVTPPACGTHTAISDLTPWSSPGKATRRSSDFAIESGPDHGPCPTGGLPPFHPDLLAGTLNNAAGSFSPFILKLTRTDSEQEITHFSIKLPPGVLGKLAGIPYCPEAGITAAIARSGPNGGAEELADPSCPAASQVGQSLAGAGVGTVLARAPGKVYLAGPYRGSALSIVAITAAKVGPFDLGTVVVREALRIDPETAEVFIDATGSDPIPHIIKGVPVHLRDLRVSVDRPDFVLNPTNCTPTSTASTVLGSGLDFASPADDNPLVVSTRFQAADCAALPFAPKLNFRLRGSTRRGGNPSLRAHLEMNGIGEAAVSYARVALPRSEFLDNAHIGTVCTRLQFRQGAIPGERCPTASVYGHVKAVTPLLDAPLQGPIYLRSSEHQLPDLVAAFHHEQINVNLVGRVDSVKGGGIRTTFEFVPDAPITSADFTFFGRGRGLLENSSDLCRGRHRASVLLKAHNGRRRAYRAELKPLGCAAETKRNRLRNQPARP